MNTEQWTKDQAAQIAEALGYGEDKRDIIAYGLFALVHTVLAIVVTAIVGVLCGVMIEALILSFTIAILRKVSGGIHATSPGRCLVIGTVVCIVGAFGGRILGSIHPLGILLIDGIIYIWAYRIIKAKAPVDSHAKPISNLKKQAFLKKKSLHILTFYMVMVMVMSLMSMQMDNHLSLRIYSSCILLGYSWQVMTLIPTGKWIIQKGDFLLINILTQMQGGRENEKN